MNIRAIGPYSQAIKLDKTTLVSGQLPVNPNTREMPGVI
ncbi:Rid family hydrolase [Siminovitchia fordii]